MLHFLCSERYYDDIYEYRHVVLPNDIAKRVPKGRLMSEVRWRYFTLFNVKIIYTS